jgi:hypothetical protein
MRACTPLGSVQADGQLRVVDEQAGLRLLLGRSSRGMAVALEIHGGTHDSALRKRLETAMLPAERLRKDGSGVWPVPPKPPGIGGFDE